jgi:D-arabinose 1-dehydrogenase-like Zn-dependent alcohol dehydrogenase
MKALVLEQYRQFAYKDVPDPAVRPDEVLIQVRACGICGSDVHGIDGSTGRRIPPVVMGIEVEDTAVAVLRFRNGALGNIVVSNAQNPGIYARIHVHGHNGATVGVQTDGGTVVLRRSGRQGRRAEQ